MDEMVSLLEKVATNPRGYASRSINDLVFTTHSGMDFNRPSNSEEPPWNEPISVQSLSFLLIDVVCFLRGGPDRVKWQDLVRKKLEPLGSKWVQWASPDEFDQRELGPLFEKGWTLARCFIQPSGPFGPDPDSYISLSTQLTRLWSSPVKVIRVPTHQQRGSTSSSMDRVSRDLIRKEIQIGGSELKWL